LNRSRLNRAEKAAADIEIPERPTFYATKKDVDTALEGLANGQITLKMPSTWQPDLMPGELVSAVLDTQNVYFRACLGVNMQIVAVMMRNQHVGPQIKPLLKTVDDWIELLNLVRPLAWDGRAKDQ
jgi:hypothetical protein